MMETKRLKRYGRVQDNLVVVAEDELKKLEDSADRSRIVDEVRAGVLRALDELRKEGPSTASPGGGVSLKDREDLAKDQYKLKERIAWRHCRPQGEHSHPWRYEQISGSKITTSTNDAFEDVRKMPRELCPRHRPAKAKKAKKAKKSK